MASDMFTLMTLNAGGRKSGRGYTMQRRQAVSDSINELLPDIVFVQMLGVKDIRGKAWIDTEKKKDYSLPRMYIFTGNKDRGIIYNEDRVSLNSKTDVYNAVDKSLENSDSSDSSEDLEERISNITLSNDVYDPRDRMCARRFTLTSTKGKADIVCISWHGRSNNPAGGAMSKEERKKLFTCYMEFLEKFQEVSKVPLIIGGDYNIEKSNIEDDLPFHFQLDAYNQGGRRQGNPIDYFISHGVEVEKVHSIHWDDVTDAKDPNKVLDHDPIIGLINIEHLTSRQFTLMTLNGGGRKSGRGYTMRRRQAVSDCINELLPDIAFVQELGVKDIRGKAWIDTENKKDYSLPRMYIFTGNKDRGIIYNEDRVSLNSKTDVYNAVDKSLENSDSSDSSEDLEERISNITLSNDVYDPRDRMCARRFTLTSTKGKADIVCMSWHGRSNNPAGGAMSKKEKKKLFKCYMEFLEKFQEVSKAPLIIGGDYNIEKSTIEDDLPFHFQLDAYNQGGRRQGNPIDYFISYGVEVEKVHRIRWDDVTDAKDPNKVLDHDPIIGQIDIKHLKS